MLQVEIKGLTGNIKFDNEGFRTDFLLDVVELHKAGLRKVGSWSSTTGINLTKTFGEDYTHIVEILQNKTLTITTILVSGVKLILFLKK